MSDNFFWNLLINIQAINIKASFLKENSKIFSIGKGEVNVSLINPNTIKFTESGLWEYVFGKNMEIHFKNSYLWTHYESSSLITLEHLRYGEKNPIFLFSLKPCGNSSLKSSSPHFCRDDSYNAEIEINDNSFILRCFVKGPSKNEEIFYTYS